MTTPVVQHVYFGKIDAMIAECSIVEMEQEWLDQYNFKYAVLPVGEDQHDTTFCETYKEALACAKELAGVYGCDVCPVY